MRKSKKAMIIDGNHLMHRAYNKFKPFKGRSGPTSIVYGFPHILQSLVRTHKPDFLVVVFDGGKDPIRMSLLPDYKKRKPKDDFDYEDFIRQRKELKKFLTALRVPVVHMADREADDIIWLLARRLYRYNYFVEIVSSDKDFNQLINEKIRVWNPYKNIHIHHKNVEKLVGYTPDRCVDYLLLAGDTSDNIPGLKGIGDKRAKAFIAKWESIPAYLQSDVEEKGFPKEELQKIWDMREIVDIKYFCREYGLSIHGVEYLKLPKKIDPEKLRQLCSKHTITTFYKKEFYGTFENLKRTIK